MYLENSLVDGKQRSEELFQLEDGLLFFTGGGGGRGVGKFFTCKHFLYAACSANNFCAFVFLQTTFFACIQCISVFTTSANSLFQKFPPPPPPSKKIMVRP